MQDVKTLKENATCMCSKLKANLSCDVGDEIKD